MGTNTLVFIDIFCGWVEAFLIRSEGARIVSKKILNKIVHRWGITLTRGLAVATVILQMVSNALGKI